MTQQKILPSSLKAIRVMSLIILIVVMAGLFSVNYINSIAIIAGAIIYFLLVKLLRLVGGRNLLLLVFILFGFVITFVFSFLFYLPLNSIRPCEVSYYRVVATPKTPQLNGITIQEFVIPKNSMSFTPPVDWTATYIGSETGFSLPEIEATIENRGFLLKEASFRSSIYCSDKVNVELHDFPLNSFYAAHYAQGLEKFPYIDTETITWNSSDESVRFSYVTPPFQIVKPILNPLMGASSMNQWLMGFIGIIGTVIFAPIIKPVFTEIAQKSIKNKISSPDVQTKQTAKLIISEKGEEKEIEVKKKR